MSDTKNGWPDKPGVPTNPERDGWHWVSLLGGDYPQIMEWFSDAMVWAEDWTVDACALHLRYLSPILTPAEVAALQKKGCARDQTTTQYCAEVMSRDARIAELEAAVATIQAERNQLIGVLQLAVEQSGETGENEPAWLGPACRIMNAGFTKIAALEGKRDE